VIGKEETMKKVFVAVVALLAFASLAVAQQPAPDGNVVFRHQRVLQGPEGGPPPPPDSTFVFMASESFGGKVVKGAPYSAEAVTETIQTLADGNRIVNRVTSMVYRDGEGRTRREQNFKGLGIFGQGEEPLQTIFINDPVAGVTYALDTRSHVAHKSVPFTFDLKTKPGTTISTMEGQRFEFKVTPGAPGANGNVIIAAPPGAPMPHPDVDTFTLKTQAPAGAVAGATYVFKTRTGPNANEKKEDLGKQNIEGVEAEGTRTTVTIPAGEIGNERPIEIVTETWFSPELHTMVLREHSDPRLGDSTYKLTDIKRNEPDASLFQPPPGTKVSVEPMLELHKEMAPSKE